MSNNFSRLTCNKKGMFEGSKTLLNIGLGLILLALGTIEILRITNIINFSIPELPLILILVFLAVSGFYLFIDGIMVLTMHPTLALLDIILGLITAAFGLVPLLQELGSITLGFTIFNVIAANVIFIIIGIILIINSWNF